MAPNLFGFDVGKWWEGTLGDLRQHLVKPISEKLDTIAKNTLTGSTSLTGSLKFTFIDASVGFSDRKVPFSKRFVYFVGLAPISGGASTHYDTNLDSNQFGMAISFETPSIQNRLHLKPDTIFAIPTDLSGALLPAFITATATHPTLDWLFVETDDPNFLRLSHPPFVENVTGALARAKVDSNHDQYVLFRNPPTITLPTPTRVRITDDDATDADVSAPVNIAAATLGLTVNSRLYGRNTAGVFQALKSKLDLAGSEYVQVVNVENLNSADLGVTAVGAAGAAVTLTLPADLVTGFFHHICLLEISAYATATVAGGAVPTTVTSTNLPGAPAWTFPSARLIGDIFHKEQWEPTRPIRASAPGVATTIVCPATATVIWRVHTRYYLAE